MRLYSSLPALLLVSSLHAQPICEDLNAGFTQNITPNGVQFSNGTTGTGEQTTWLWSFGDGAVSYQPQPFHAYATGGTYEVCLFVSTLYFNGSTPPLTCTDTACVVLNIGDDDPCADLSADFWFGNNGIPASIFFSASTGAGPHWLWSFGDGTYSDNGPQGTHTYTAAGTYELCLTVWDWIPNTDDTCAATTCQLVVIEGGDPCDDFSACFVTNDLGDGGFFFDNCSSNQGNGQFHWSFGDGTASTAVNAEHHYSEAGTYEVCLYAYYASCADTTCTTVVVSSGNDPCNGLEAAFTWSTTPNGTQFSNGTTGTGQSTSWHWTYGDGTSSNDAQPFHTFLEPGGYEVCLTTISIYPNTAGGMTTCVDTACTMVVIEGGPDPCNDLEACFVASQTGQMSVFFNNCTAPGTNTQYVWHFGDGSTGSGVSPTHSYDQPGTYTVCLTAYWNGCVDEYCGTVVVQGNNNPCNDLSAAFEVLVSGSIADFQNAVVSGAMTYTWYFGDGSEGYGPNPAHTYPGPGTYTACLLVWAWNPLTQDTCFADHCELVTIEATASPCDELEAGFIWTTTPNGTQFSNGTSGTGFSSTWHWSFGDGATSNDAQPFHTYAEPGEYEVCLHAASIYEISGGNVITCVDTSCAIVTIGGGDPCVDFEACFVTNDLGNGTYFFDNCSSNQGSGQFYWTFGDGAVSTVVNAEHHYSQPGTYTVCLYAYYLNCSDTTCTTIVVQGSGGPCEELEAGFTWTTTPNGTQFSNTTGGTGFSSTWHWTFGDGTTSNDGQPFHTYAEAGEYEVCLYVASRYELSSGNVITCTDTVCTVVIIQGGGDPCDDLNACFETVVIDDNSFVFVNCTDPTTNTQYVWAFGDGTSVGGVNADHSYQQPGTYTVCLTAYWGNCVDSTCTTIVVGGGGGCQPFQVDFVHSAQGTAVVFEATASVPVVGLLWYFGDGSEGYGPVVTHLYEPPGPFNVCVAAWYWNGATQDTCWAEHCEWVDPFQNGVGLPENLDDAIHVYPNPARSVISIDGLSSNGDVLMYSPEGRLVMRQRMNTTRHVMSVEHLAPAIYSLELRTTEGSLWRRIAIE